MHMHICIHNTQCLQTQQIQTQIDLPFILCRSQSRADVKHILHDWRVLKWVLFGKNALIVWWIMNP